MSVAEFNFDIGVSTLIAVIIAVYYKRRYGDEIFKDKRTWVKILVLVSVANLIKVIIKPLIGF
ncbi:hypothetical protein [Methanobrevibacter smithii]|jgi:hypothetical protein|uniref:hypothetical protein n=1 Tax=Methanobrevibacter smithii TaxID=2173 RepID=UPI0025D79DAD|nr:hypothetical protein [Methanobrevibacter smithii]